MVYKYIPHKIYDIIYLYNIAEIKIDSQSENTGTERLITITGTSSQVQSAAYMINQSLAQH